MLAKLLLFSCVVDGAMVVFVAEVKNEGKLLELETLADGAAKYSLPEEIFA